MRSIFQCFISRILGLNPHSEEDEKKVVIIPRKI
jgi:hypothetical protein